MGDLMRDPQQLLAGALAACARGERDGLRMIFDTEAPRLVTIAHRILRRQELAEDIVQEAFIQIWRKAHQYSPERGSARGWIYAIVRNRALNALRDARREDLSDAESLERLQEDAQDGVAPDILMEMDAASRLRDCLERLDETKRRSVLMAYMSGYTHGEIAGRLKVPLGTAKAWVRRGLTSLRECMA
jgi:RNA polymerase sigma-70 factor (ECF subfamily)